MGAGAQQQYDTAYAQCMVGNGAIIQGQPVAAYAAPAPVAYPAPYPYAYPLGFTPIFIATPGWYHGRYYAYRGYYDPHSRFMRGIPPQIVRRPEKWRPSCGQAWRPHAQKNFTPPLDIDLALPSRLPSRP
jgi:hypothetical protein